MVDAGRDLWCVLGWSSSTGHSARRYIHRTDHLSVRRVVLLLPLDDKVPQVSKSPDGRAQKRRENVGAKCAPERWPSESVSEPECHGSDFTAHPCSDQTATGWREREASPGYCGARGQSSQRGTVTDRVPVRSAIMMVTAVGGWSEEHRWRYPSPPSDHHQLQKN